GSEIAEDALPERVPLCHGVALVRHADLREPVRGGVLERMPDDAVHALPGIELLLDGDLVFRSRLEAAADADVEPLGILTEDDEVDVGGTASLQRTEAFVEQPHRAVVDEQIELEACPEQDVAGVAIVGDAGIPERTDEHGV